ncbi:MAG: flippase-like domain-containing protein [Lachnospiraceae bacterium]|nr:flippase-like domain-containing protein [Lachnospiraceae bacterium]
MNKIFVKSSCHYTTYLSGRMRRQDFFRIWWENRTLSKKYVKYIANTIFLTAIFAGTYYLLFRDQELPDIMESVRCANNSYLYAGIGLAILYVCSESVIIHYLMHAIKQRITFLKCIRYSFVGFFFSSVTPSASGGQPMQVYFMSKDGIDVAVSTLVLMVVTIVYKAVLVILSAVMGITELPLLRENVTDIWFFVLFGIIANIGFIILLCLGIFEPGIAKKLSHFVLSGLGRLKLIRNTEKWKERLENSLKKYGAGAAYIRENKKVLVHVFFITLFQRLCLFAVTYLVYRSFGLKGISAYKIITLQTIIALAVDSLPLPGGIGASEKSFLIVFAGIFGKEFVLPGMLLSRGITYYALILISAVVIIGTQLLYGFRKKKRVVGKK